MKIIKVLMTGLFVGIIISGNSITSFASTAKEEPVIEISTNPSLPAPNLIRNPGFEKGSGVGGFPLFWKGTVAPGKVSIEVTEEKFYRGTKSLRIRSSVGATSTCFTNPQLPTGVPLILKGWIYVEKGISPERVGISLHSRDNKERYMGGMSVHATINDNWERLEVCGQLPEGSCQFSIELSMGFPGTVYFDDIFVSLAYTELTCNVSHSSLKRVQLFNEDDILVADSGSLKKGTNTYSFTKKISTQRTYCLRVEDYKGRISSRGVVVSPDHYLLKETSPDNFLLSDNVIARLENKTGSFREVEIETRVIFPSGKEEVISRLARLEINEVEEIRVKTKERGKYSFSVKALDPKSKEIYYRSPEISFYIPRSIVELSLNQKYHTFEKDLVASVRVTEFPELLKSAKLKVRLRPKGGEALKTKWIKDVSAIAFLDFDISSYPPGTYIISASLLDEEERSLAAASKIFYKQKGWGDSPEFEIKDKVLMLDGASFFPIGIYAGRAEEKDLKKIAEHGFNTVFCNWRHLPYLEEMGDFGYYAGKTKLSLDSYLSVSHALNLKVIIDFTAYLRSGNSKYLQRVKEIVSMYKEHPAVLAWHPWDETTFVGQVSEACQAIKEIDPPRPIFILVFGNYSEFYPVLDIISNDPYPITRTVANNRARYIRNVAVRTDKMRQAVRNEKPVWMVLQAFEGDGGKYLLPTPEEERCMTYLAINHGANGILYYDYLAMYPEKNPTLWNSFKSLTAELTQLTPIILSPAPEQTISSSQDCIDVLLKEYKGKKYLIAVNTKNKPIRVKFHTPHIPDGSTVKTLFEDRETLSIKNKSFRDNFIALGVHVYECAE